MIRVAILAGAAIVAAALAYLVGYQHGYVDADCECES